jgi:glycosyltransferase involved in cell wall biosynthesis
MKHAKMVYCIQDFNPEQIMAINYSKNRLILNFMLWLDKFSCKHSDLVITVGRDLGETLKGRFKYLNVPKHTMINNWIDEKEIYPLPYDNEKVIDFKKQYGLDDKFIFMYSGNIGLYYNLDELLKIIKRFRKGTTLTGIYEPGMRTLDGREVVFVFVGNGSLLDSLIKYRDRHQIKNVIFIPYQNKKDLIFSLNAGDVHLCVNAKGIKGVSVPSKCYGIMAVGKPILGILEHGSEARLLIEEADCGICCEPDNYTDVEHKIAWFIKNSETKEVLNMGHNGREYLIKYLTKDISIKKYVKAITEC